MTATLHPYPTYKPSGVPWLGDMPEHWEVRRGGWLFRKMDRPVRDADEVVTRDFPYWESSGSRGSPNEIVAA